MITLNHYLFLSAILFTIGAVGVMVRRHLIIILMCLELMLNAANLAFVGFSRYLGSIEGQVIVLFVLVVAAAEVAVGLAIVVSLYRTQDTMNINDINLLKW